jgi:hypothetical protein
MWLVHTKGKTWYIVLYEHTMYVISLSNISIKSNFKQITKIKLIFTNFFYNTLRKNTFCAWHHVICCRSFSATVQSDNAFKKEKWTLQLPKISKLCLWKWEYDCEFTMHNMNEWTLSSRFVYVVNIDVFFPAFQWYDVMIKEFGRERRAILLSPQCGDTTSCIRHLVSDRLLSLISKENVHNVR